MKPARQVVIDIYGGKEEYKFRGPWSGLDVTLVKTHLSDRYKRYMRSIRRGEKMPIVTTEEAVNVVVQNGIEWSDKTVGWEQPAYPIDKPSKPKKKRSK